MEFLLHTGVNWVIAIQSLGEWPAAPMRFFTFLGSEDFFFLVLPLLYWSVDAGLGLRVGLALVTSDALIFMFKLAFAAPRPYWVSMQVQAYSAESSFGIPSGHAQHAMAIWGIMANGVRKPWAWLLAFTLVFLIGFSRIYLGVHFVSDVIAGWLAGGLLLWVFIRSWDSAARWLKRKTLDQQLFIVFAASLIFLAMGVASTARLDSYSFPEEWESNALRAGPVPNPVSIEAILTSAGSLFGLAAGAAWIASRGGYRTMGPLEKRALRYGIGLIGILILWLGLGQIFPRDESLISYVLRYLRYTLVGFWVTAGAPWLFFRFKLADGPNR